MFDSTTFLKNLTTRSGIYKMLNADGEIIYIGKAKNLNNRVASYFKNSSVSLKQQAMEAKIAPPIPTGGSIFYSMIQTFKQLKPHSVIPASAKPSALNWYATLNLFTPLTH